MVELKKCCERKDLTVKISMLNSRTEEKTLVWSC